MKLRGRNVNSLKGDFMVDFTASPLQDSGIFAITGPTGAGKTTLLDTICLAMYNTIPRRSNPREDVMTKHTSDCLAEVEFKVGESIYRSSWTQKRSYGKADGKLQQPKMELALKKGEVFEIEETHIGKVLIRIEEITGLDFARFGQSIMLAQGSFMAFLSADDNSRANLLEKMTGTEIYAEISKLAYQRSILEEEKLLQLQKESESLEILSAEEIRAKEADLSSFLSTLHGNDLKINQLKRDSARCKDLAEYRQRLVELQKSRTETLTEIEASNETFKRLKLYEESENLREAVAGKQRIASDQLHNSEELIGLKKHEEKLRLDLVDLKAACLKSDSDLRDFNSYYNTRISLIEQAKGKDMLIQKLLDKKTRFESQFQTLKAKKEQEDQLLGKVLLRLESLEKARFQTEKELEKLNDFEKIDEKLPLLEELLEKFAFETKKALEYKQRIDALEKNIDDARKKEEIFSLSLIEEEKSLSASTERYEVIRSGLKKLFGDSNEIQNSEILLQLDQQKDFLEKIVVLKQKISEAKISEAEINKNISEIQERLPRLLSAREQLELQQKLQQEKIVEINKRLKLELKFVELDSERKRLVEGEPCPLCGSIHHPLALENAPNPSMTEKELAQDSEKLKKMTTDLTTIVTDISVAESKLESEMASLQKIDELIRVTAGEISGLLEKGQFSEKFSVEQAQNQLHGVVSEYEMRLGLQKKAQEITREMLDCERKTNDIKNQMAEHKLRHEKSLFELKEHQTVLDSIQEKLSACSDEFEQLRNRSILIFKEFNILCESSDFQPELEELKRLSLAFSEKRKGLKALENDVEASRLDEKTHQLNLKELQVQVIEADKALVELNHEIETLKDERLGLLGESGTDLAMNSLIEQKHALERNAHGVTQSLNICESELKSIADQQVKLEKSDQKLFAELQKVEGSVCAMLFPFGFNSEAEFIAALPEKDKIDELKMLRESLQTKINQTQARIEEVERKLEEFKEFAEINVEVLHADLEACENISEDLRLKISAIKHLLAADEKNRDKLGKKGSEITAQRKEKERWAKLKNLIGSSEGDKFRKFAQGLTLEILVNLANQKLRLFNNRYQLIRKSSNDMNLEIVDTFQADVRRPVNTLSGGESFLVSLALALGLSDLASKRIKIESLFLDEGFGTLDSDTLDTALSALNQLQGEGRTIGIISHVESLKERVPVQIMVVPTTSGHSSVSVVG